MSASEPDRAELAPYAAIVAHAELELELAAGGELTELAGLDGRWNELVAGLPERPPSPAVSLLARAKLLHERTRTELLAIRETILGEVAGAQQAKRTAAGYVGTTRHAPALDRSA